MLRALAYVGEHRVSFCSYADALLRVEHRIYGGRYRSILLRALAARDSLNPATTEKGPEIDTKATGTGHRLNPQITDTDRVLHWILRNEMETIEELRSMDFLDAWKARHEIGAVLIFHESGYPYRELVEPDDVTVHSDTTADDGIRVIRVVFPVRRLVTPAPATTDARHAELLPGDVLETDYQVFAGLVFDEAGRLVMIHADRPWGEGK